MFVAICGLCAKRARNWRLSTERLKDGERPVKASYIAAIWLAGYGRATSLSLTERPFRRKRSNSGL